MAQRPLLDALEVRAPSVNRLAARAVMRLPTQLRRKLLFDAFDRAEAAFNRGDLEVVFAAFADDVDYVPPEPLPEAGPLRGKAAVMSFWQGIFERFEENSIENRELIELRRGVLLRRAALTHRQRDGAELAYEIEQTTEFRAGQVIRQHNHVLSETREPEAR